MAAAKQAAEEEKATALAEARDAFMAEKRSLRPRRR